jgi:two-component system chemotaxis response regulator CheB
MGDRRDLVVIGASAGGIEAVSAILANLPADLAAAVMVVLHTAPHGPSVLPAVFSRAGKLPAQHPYHGEKFRQGRVYVAPPDHHLLISGGHLLVVKGPTENHTRPAIDPLFRSAALNGGARVIGVVLTGYLDDGTAGLAAIKARGGVAIVQDPDDAREPSMPLNALEHVQADRVLPAAQIGPAIAGLVGERVPAAPAASRALEIETRIAAAEADMLHERPGTAELGPPSPFSCPECSGVLFEMAGMNPLRFRCRTGHAYSAKSLMADQTSALEGALWTALRALEESAALARRVASQSRTPRTAQYLNDVARERIERSEEIRRAIMSLRATALEEGVGQG